jgi:hypothetical protein
MDWHIVCGPSSSKDSTCTLQHDLSKLETLNSKSSGIVTEKVIMLHLQTILHPTDFSGPVRIRLSAGLCSLARGHDTRLILLHVWSLPPFPDRTSGRAPVRPEDFSPGPVEDQLRRLHVPDATVRVERRRRFPKKRPRAGEGQAHPPGQETRNSEW